MITMYNDPLLNICIPYYNCSEWIEEALRSIKKQTYKNYKVYICNDGSKIEEKNKLYSIVKKLNIDATIYNQEHRGLLSARYCMFKKIHEGIIISLDADDFYLTDDVFLKIAKKYSSSDCDAVFFNMTKDISKKKNLINLEEINDKETALKYFILNNTFNSIVCKSFMYNLIDLDMLFSYQDIIMAEDRLSSLALFKNLVSVSVINQPFYYYRTNKNSIVNNSFDKNKYLDQLKVEAEVKKFAEKHQLDYYSYEKYISENIIYTDIFFIYNNYNCYNQKKANWKSLHNWVNEIKLQNKIDKTIKLHRKICLSLFFNRNWFLLFLMLRLCCIFK